MPASNRPDDSLIRLRPYTFHGTHLEPSGAHAIGDCPFCGREDKIAVEIVTGVGRCLLCATGSAAGGGFNGLSFTRLVYEQAAAAERTNPTFSTTVAADRRLLQPTTVVAWGICPAADGTWLVPGYGTDGKLDQVYRRTSMKDKGEWVWRLLPTPGIWPEGKAHALHMPVNDFDPARPNIMVCEGPWDGMALWEVWPRDATTNIIAVPGCNVWRDEWTELCRGKNVTLLYDSDHPRTLVYGSRVSRAGYDGMERVAKKLSGAAASVKYIKWGEEGYNPERPTGWDVRDELSTSDNRQDALRGILARIEDAPKEWFNPSAQVASNGHHTNSVEALPCSQWIDCLKAWEDAMQWRQDMSDAMAILLAVCASTQQGGNQLFIQLIGCAGSGKTTMCDGLLVSGHCHHLEHLTGFHSGWKLPEDGQKDCSLISRINGKTLVTPEADVLISSPRFQEIMSQQRRIFDGKSGATYKNTDKDTLYAGLRTPWIMAGTPAMLDHDQSHLGDRFLRFIIADPSENEKRSIIRSAIRSEREAMQDQANGTAGSVVDRRMRKAHALTGGYVDWLRAHIEEELINIQVPDFAEEYCMDLADLSADLRARPIMENRKRMTHDTHDTKELPTRLARQNIRLATCLAVVLNKPSVDTEVLRIVRKVALDTAVGHSLNIVQWLCSRNPHDTEHKRLYQETGGIMNGILQTWTGMEKDHLCRYLLFMRKIGILVMHSHPQMGNSWTLTERVYNLYLRVMKG